MAEKKDDDKIDPREVEKLPTYQPERPTPYDKYTEKPTPAPKGK